MPDQFLRDKDGRSFMVVNCSHPHEGGFGHSFKLYSDSTHEPVCTDCGRSDRLKIVKYLR